MWRNGASHCEYDGKSMQTEKTTSSEFLNEGKAILEQILTLEERKKSKKAGPEKSQSGMWVGKLIIWGENPFFYGFSEQIFKGIISPWNWPCQLTIIEGFAEANSAFIITLAKILPRGIIPSKIHIQYTIFNTCFSR